MDTLKNYLYSLSIQIINIIIPLITLPIITNALGKEGVGIISISTSILSYFLILGSTGLVSFGNREIAKSEKNDLTKSFNRVFSILIFYSIISFFTYSLLIIFISPSLKPILIICSLQIIASILDFSWFFYGINEIRTVAIRNFIIRLLGLFLIFIFIKNQDDIYAYFIILGIITLLSNLLILPILKNKIQIKDIHINFRINKSELSNSFFIVLPLFIIAIYSNIDRFIILSFFNYESVGVYDVGVRIIAFVSILIVSLRPIMISKISANLNNTEKMEGLIKKSISLVFYVSIPICVALYLNIDKFISLFLGYQFNQTAFIIKLLIVQILLTGIGDIFVNQILIAIGQERKVFTIMTILCIMLVILYLILIPLFGMYGAAIGSVIAHLFILFIEYSFVKKFINIKIEPIEILKCIIAGSMVLALLKLLGIYYKVQTYLDLLLTTFLIISLYLVICNIFKHKLQFEVFNVLFKKNKN